jgi:hypothetical protein
LSPEKFGEDREVKKKQTLRDLLWRYFLSTNKPEKAAPV